MTRAGEDESRTSSRTQKIERYNDGTMLLLCVPVLCDNITWECFKKPKS